jgi:hypothetical protein
MLDFCFLRLNLNSSRVFAEPAGAVSAETLIERGVAHGYNP